MQHLAPVDPRVTLMLDLADRAGTVAMRHFQSDTLVVESKADDSPVTAADREIETLLREGICAAFPADAILGEEHGEIAGTSGWRWVLDPIDGTVSFAAGVPLFGTLIALEHGDEVVAGICAFPALCERLWAVRGAGAWWERTDLAGVRSRVAARVRRWVRIWSITDACVMNATIRIAPWQVGQASGSTSKIRWSSAAFPRVPRGRLAYQS